MSSQLEEEEHFLSILILETLILRHNLDVMHIEKNVCDSILGTLLSIKGKTKHNLNSHLDLQVMGIINKLHLIERGNKFFLPIACYSLTPNEMKEI